MSTAPKMKRFGRINFSEEKQRRIAILIASAGVLFIAGYLIAVMLLFPPPPVPEDGISVPDLAGQTMGSARVLLEPLGLRLGDTVSLPHESAIEGTIIAQSPLPGQQTRTGSQIRVGLSAGPAAVTVPDVVGLGARRAATLLERLGFSVQQEFETSLETNGMVIRSTPSAGTRRPLPATVRLVVSSGPLVDTLTIDTTRIRTDTVPTTTTRN